MLEETVSHELFTTDVNRATDFRECSISLKMEEVSALANEFAARYSKIILEHKEAVIVDNLLIHGIFRHYISVANRPISYQIYNTKNEAVASKIKSFLDLPTDFEFPEILQPLL